VEHAEESGDIAYIDALLLPEYRSVNVDGSFNPQLHKKEFRLHEESGRR